MHYTITINSAYLQCIVHCRETLESHVTCGTEKRENKGGRYDRMFHNLLYIYITCYRVIYINLHQRLYSSYNLLLL